MAGRVNTKFVIILSAVVVVLVGGIVSVAYLSKRDANELAMRGEQYIAEGDIKRGVETLERAVNRSNSDPKIIKRYLEAMKILPAADQVEAGNILNTVRAWTLNLAQIDPNSETYLREYADLVKDTVDRIGVMEGSHPLYIYHASVARLEHNPGDELARRHRGVYGFMQLNAEMAEDDINLVRDDLLWAHDKYPEDAEVAHQLAMWKLFESRRLDRPGGDLEQAEKLKAEAIELSKAMLDAAPDDAERKLNYMIVLRRATVDPRSEDPFAEVKPVLDELEAQMLETPEPSKVVLTTARWLKDVYRTETVPEEELTGADDELKTRNVGVRRSVRLLRRAIEAHPDMGMYQLMLGVELKNSGDFDAAMPYIETVKGLSTQGLYLDVLLNYSLKRTALVEYADLLITLAETSDTDEDKQAKFDEADKIVEEAVASGFGEQPKILLMKGRLALAQGKVREGLINIDKAAEGYDAYSIDKAQALVLSARARAQQGDWGSAAERYEQILTASPKFPGVRLALARIYIRMQDFDKAQDHVDAVLVDDPTNEQAIAQQAALFGAQGQMDQAIDTYRQLDMTGRSDLAAGLARIMIQGERKEQAEQLLKLYYDADPSDLQILMLRLYITDDMAKKQALVQRSREAGADENTLAALESQLDPANQGDAVGAIENLIKDEQDPFVRAVNSARLYSRAGKPELAREALAKAEALKPDDRQVIDLRFNFALEDGEMDTAQRYADRAAQMNLDEAAGRFYLAQLQSAKQDHKGAIESLRIALEEVPINSEGWRLLGEMYIATSNDAEAVGAFERSLKQRPDNLGAIRGLAAIRDRQGRRDEALGMLKFAHKRYPENTMLRELYLVYEGKYGDKQDALRMRREFADEQPESSDNKRALAMLLAEMGQHDEGLKIIRDVIEEEGQSRLNLRVLSQVHHLSGQDAQGEQVLHSYILSRGAEATASDHMMLARYQLRIKDADGAVASYHKAMELETERREATRELAGLYFGRKGYVQALPYYRELHKQFPEELPIGLGLAEALIRTKQHEEAAIVLDGVDGGSTEDAQRALIEASRGNQDAAIRLINGAIEAEPGKARYYYERAALMANDPERTDDVISDLNTALSLDPNQLTSRRMLVAMYMRRGEKREAMREMTTMVSRHPDYAQGRLDLIQLHVNEGEMTRAKSLARAGIQQTPDESAWHSVMGGLAMKENDIPAAIESYKTVMQMVPSPANLLTLVTVQIENGKAADAQALLRDHADIVNQQPLLQAVMGRALYAVGKQSEARQVFARSAERCQSFDQLFGVITQVDKDYGLAETVSLIEGLANPPSKTLVSLALARLEVAQGESKSVVARLSALEPTLSEGDEGARQMLEKIMGPALHSEGRPEDALVYYKRVLAYEPDNTSVLNNMAYLLVEDLGKAEEALPLAQRAADLEPNNAQVLDTLGWTQYKLGQVDQAQQTLSRSIDAQSLSANHLHLAEILIDKGYMNEADRHLKTAIDLAEQNNEPDLIERAQELLKKTGELTEAS